MQQPEGRQPQRVLQAQQRLAANLEHGLDDESARAAGLLPAAVRDDSAQRSIATATDGINGGAAPQAGEGARGRLLSDCGVGAAAAHGASGSRPGESQALLSRKRLHSGAPLRGSPRRLSQVASRLRRGMRGAVVRKSGVHRM